MGMVFLLIDLIRAGGCALLLLSFALLIEPAVASSNLFGGVISQ